MFVVESRTTGDEILDRSNCGVGAFMDLGLEGGGEESLRASDRLMRLVTARARDILMN